MKELEEFSELWYPLIKYKDFNDKMKRLYEFIREEGYTMPKHPDERRTFFDYQLKPRQPLIDYKKEKLEEFSEKVIEEVKENKNILKKLKQILGKEATTSSTLIEGMITSFTKEIEVALERITHTESKMEELKKSIEK